MLGMYRIHFFLNPAETETRTGTG